MFEVEILCISHLHEVRALHALIMDINVISFRLLMVYLSWFFVCTSYITLLIFENKNWVHTLEFIMDINHTVLKMSMHLAMVLISVAKCSQMSFNSTWSILLIVIMTAAGSSNNLFTAVI